MDISQYIHFFCSLVVSRFGALQIIVLLWTLRTCLLVKLCVHFWWVYSYRVALLNHRVMYISTFSRVWQKVFQSGQTIAHSHQQSMRAPHLSLSTFEVIILFSVSHSDTYVVISYCSLVCRSPKPSGVEHFFMSLMDIHISYFVKFLFKYFPIFIDLFAIYVWVEVKKT